VIRVRDLHKRYGALEVLKGISLDVPKGEVAVVMGPSGGGKSTFLRCLNGLERFDAGEVAVDGLSLGPATDPRRDARLLQQVRRRVGFVFQQFHLFPHLTALENVIEAPVHVLRRPRDEATERARALLDRVGLADKADELPRRLSGGQQQRVAIARALAMEPEAILFDEPTSALDPVMTAEVLAVIADLARAGQTMVVVTHAVAFARRAASVVHVFADGRCVESGAPGEVLDAPRSPAARALLRPT
jgi:ABC-type polar amino acid transport system ATPase subunit